LRIEGSYTQNLNLNLNLNQKSTISLSKDTLDNAKNLNILPSQTAVIFGNEVIALDNKNLDSLKKEFKNDFVDYDGIVIAKDNAENYLNNILNYVNNDLNIANADKNRDDLITMGESLDIRNIVDVDNKSLLKPREILSEEEILEIEKDTAILITTADIFNIHIELDKNKDGKITLEEITESKSTTESNNTNKSDNKDILEELYKKQRELFKQISQLSSVANPSDSQQSQINGLNAQLQGINAQISAILKQREKM